MVYFNDSDPFACDWLRELMAKGLIPEGDVDDRSICDVRPGDVSRYDQCHFFAGIGGWSLALELAGYKDLRCWTGSCPCPSFSSAGRGEGFEDPRGRLWEEFYRLIRQCRPPIVFGEQVEAAIGYGWLALVSADLDSEGYDLGAAVLPAACVGAPQRRARLWWGGVLPDARGERPGERQGDADALGRGEAGGLSDPHGEGLEGPARTGKKEQEPRPSRRGDDGRPGSVGNPLHDGQPPRQGETGAKAEGGRRLERQGHGFWDDVEWLHFRDGKWRPIEPRLMPMANGVSKRMGRIRGFGNAIVPQVGAEFIRAFLD